MRIPIIVANWKMHGSRQQSQEFMAIFARQLQQAKFNQLGISKLEILICPPAILLPFISEITKQVKIDPNIKLEVGGQNCYFATNGAYTGEISALMLKDFFCQYVILGHSERRQLFMETDELIAKKFLAVCNVGLKPILCIGETQQQREQGNTLKIIASQLEAVLKLATLEMLQNTVIAYEPIWAIGTGLTAKPEQVEEVHSFIRDFLVKRDQTLATNMRIIYGGSVKSSNAKELFSQPNVDGGLVGGASLVAEEFVAICQQIKIYN